MERHNFKLNTTRTNIIIKIGSPRPNFWSNKHKKQLNWERVPVWSCLQMNIISSQHDASSGTWPRKGYECTCGGQRPPLLGSNSSRLVTGPVGTSFPSVSRSHDARCTHGHCWNMVEQVLFSTFCTLCFLIFFTALHMSTLKMRGLGAQVPMWARWQWIGNLTPLNCIAGFCRFLFTLKLETNWQINFSHGFGKAQSYQPGFELTSSSSDVNFLKCSAPKHLIILTAIPYLLTVVLKI